MNEHVLRAAYLIRGHRGRALAVAMRRRVYWDRESVGLRRSLEKPLRAPPAAIPLTVRPIQPEDADAFTDLSAAADVDDALERATAQRLLASRLRTCYVAVTDDGTPCYRQFLVLPDENARLGGIFEGLIPPLRDGEALLESAYTVPAYRARGVMPYVMGVLAGRAAEAGARSLVTYASRDNELFVRFYRRLGFEPFVLRRDSIRLLRRRVTFTPIEEGTPL